jgi:DNA gyrase/topoisomerase IV subunit A
MVAKPPVEDDFAERILDVDVSSEMETSFLEYAYSVIYSRALPDARDGLKPVQRRILYGMDQMRIRPDVSHVKCSRVVGQVMGLYHPHGDAAIYEALVRLGQSWSMRLPTIDGHGNFGSLDSGPAAMRYTECRMAPAAVAMTADIESDTVDFRPNYDGKETEPVVLPAAFPNLLVNGSTGIAVGMATNIAPHNLVEVVQALKHLLTHPDADSEDLMRFVPGPDFPTGGKIIGLDGVREAYLTGRGQFKVRASARIEQVTPRRKGIVVTELPYLIGPERIIEQVKTLVGNKKLTGIAVGMATNIAPHNLVEVVQALKHLLKHPDADSEELMRYVPGPDFPTGGKIIGLDGVREAYLTGRGQFKVRASARIEQVTPRRKGIVVTELPYQVGPERIIEQVKTLVTSKRLTGIADIKDLTDLANGTRLVIEVKNGINPDALLEELYRLTKLEDSFSANNVALVDGQPQTMPLRQMLTVYLDHRLDVIRRRSAYLLGKAKDRLHLVEGLLLAIVDIDDVIAIIRTSDDAAQARTRLMDAFELTEIQALSLIHISEPTRPY